MWCCVVWNLVPISEERVVYTHRRQHLNKILVSTVSTKLHSIPQQMSVIFTVTASYLQMQWVVTMCLWASYSWQQKGFSAFRTRTTGPSPHCHMPQELYLQQQCCKNLKSHAQGNRRLLTTSCCLTIRTYYTCNIEMDTKQLYILLGSSWVDSITNSCPWHRLLSSTTIKLEQ